MSPGIRQTWHGVFLRPCTNPPHPSRVSQMPWDGPCTLPVLHRVEQKPSPLLRQQRDAEENIEAPHRRMGESSRMFQAAAWCSCGETLMGEIRGLFVGGKSGDSEGRAKQKDVESFGEVSSSTGPARTSRNSGHRPGQGGAIAFTCL